MKNIKTIVHVTEAGAGVTEFIYQIVNNLPNWHHCIISADRSQGPLLDRLYQINRDNRITLKYWKYAGRRIHPIKDFLAFLTLFALLRNCKFDIVHLHASKAGFIGRWVCFFLRFKCVIYSPHSIPFSRKLRGAELFLFKTLEKLGSLLCGKVICSSYSENEFVIKCRIQSDYINNGTTLVSDVYPKQFNKNKIVIINIARIVNQKNPAMFNKIASHFLSSSYIEFWWIGEGELEQELSSVNIKKIGWVSPPLLYNYLCEADLYLSTSSWEGSSMAAIEAMNYCKPLLLTNCVGNRDMVIEGWNGFLFNDATEAIQRISYLINNSHLFKQMGGNSKQNCIKNFNIKTTCKYYEMEYEKFKPRKGLGPQTLF